MVKLADLKKLATDDYQNRGGNSPASGTPTQIEVYEDRGNLFVDGVFKSTSEKAAKDWMTRYIKAKGYKVEEIETEQDGDYEDDWVIATVKLGK